MKTFWVTFFVGNATKVAHKLEQVAYGYRMECGRWLDGKVDEEDLDAIELVESAINAVYAGSGEEVTLELPDSLTDVFRKYLETAEEATDTTEDDPED